MPANKKVDARLSTREFIGSNLKEALLVEAELSLQRAAIAEKTSELTKSARVLQSNQPE